MIDHFHLLDDLKSALNDQGRLAYYDSARKELITRCPYCGDSIKNTRHGHLYISTEAPFSYFCHRCESRGFLNLQTLRDFVSDLSPEVSIALHKEALKAIRNTTQRLDYSDLSGTRKLILPYYNEESKIYNRKLKYLENRLGCELTIKDLKDLKVIMNYEDFLARNYLKNLYKFYNSNDYNKDLFKWLKVYSIGFLSSDHNYINFRHTKLPTNERRYYTESMNKPLNIGSRIYTIANEVDLYTPRLKLILTEGVMDVASVWINLYDRLQVPDTIFGSVNGRAFKAFVDIMRQNGFLEIDLEIYSDSDKSLSEYKWQLNFDYFSNIKVHYNRFKGEKDFGVPKERIDIETYILKR